MISDTGAELLSEAIIQNAVKDYIGLLNGSIKESIHCNKRELETFFLGDWCKSLLGNDLDGNTIISVCKVRAEYQRFRKEHKCDPCKRSKCIHNTEVWENAKKGNWKCQKMS